MFYVSDCKAGFCWGMLGVFWGYMLYVGASNTGL